MDTYAWIGLGLLAIGALLYRTRAVPEEELRAAAPRAAATPTRAPEPAPPSDAPWPAAGQCAQGHHPGSVTLHLREAGYRKIDAIKAVRSITGVSLKAAKDLIETPDAIVLLQVAEPIAASAERALAGAGCVTRRA